MIWILLCIIAITALAFMHYKTNQNNNINQYRKTKQRTLGNNPLQKTPKYTPFSDDADVILDIKKTEKPSANARTIALFLLADDAPFAGYELQQSMLNAGLRFGAKQIFHYYSDNNVILFHCASAEHPGTFDIANMGNVQTRGLCFFMMENEVDHPIKAFDMMLHTIDQLVDDLGGRVFDEQKNLFTHELLLQYRQSLLKQDETVF